MVQKCMECRWWTFLSSGSSGTWGRCRVEPPQIIPNATSGRGQWPITDDDAWCAKFLRNKPLKEE